jgi:DNA end-binding protein Ku
VPNDQVVKGWKKTDGTYLLFTAEEIASLQAEKSKGMEIKGFVDFTQVDPIWLGPSNFIGPVDKTTLRMFLLLFESMKQENLAAVASYYGHGRDKRGILRAGDETLILHDCFFPAELRTYAEQAKVELTKTEFSNQERLLGKQLIDALRCDFQPLWMTEMVGDTFLARVEQLKDARDKGLPMPEGLPPTPTINEGADLMALLQGSVASIKGKRQIDGAVSSTKPPVKIEIDTVAVPKKKKRA